MRILHLDSGRSLRGGQWQVLRLVEGLAAAGVESTVLARKDGPLFEAARDRGWRVEPLSLARAFLLARRHDLVHAHDARSHTLAAIAGGAPLVVSRRVAFAVGSRWKYGRARRYLAVSEFVKSVLMAGGVPEEKIAVVYDGVPLLEQANGTRVAAPEKGSALAMEAARLAGVELLISTNLQRDLAQTAVLVYLSHSEGLGSGALLALSAGVPVVASRTGGLPEIVRHRETGLLVENQPEQVAAAIHELAAGRELARKLGQAGRRMVAERFTVDHMVRRTMEVYRTVIK
jgi:Glycosyl transferases group 1/Glycosyltransferase Family 4